VVIPVVVIPVAAVDLPLVKEADLPVSGLIALLVAPTKIIGILMKWVIL